MYFLNSCNLFVFTFSENYFIYFKNNLINYSFSVEGPLYIIVLVAIALGLSFNVLRNDLLVWCSPCRMIVLLLHNKDSIWSCCLHIKIKVFYFIYLLIYLIVFSIVVTLWPQYKIAQKLFCFSDSNMCCV